MARLYRAKHHGTLSEKPSAAHPYLTIEAAERRAEMEKLQLPNPLYGHMTFTVVADPGEDAA